MSAEEYRSEWPGGIETDANTGHAKFEVDPGKVASREGHEVVRPVWACSFCAKKLKHTEAEHAFAIRAGKAGQIQKAAASFGKGWFQKGVMG